MVTLNIQHAPTLLDELTLIKFYMFYHASLFLLSLSLEKKCLLLSSTPNRQHAFISPMHLHFPQHVALKS